MAANIAEHQAHHPDMRVRLSLTILLCLLIGLKIAATAEPTLRIIETQLVDIQAGGAARPPAALVGLELSIGRYQTRINAIQPDPYHPALTLYNVSFRNPTTGEWEPLCHPGPHGLALAVPIPGYWRQDGTYHPLPPGQFTFTCTAGAHVKCLRMGYYPWATTPKGASLAPYHQACTRMIRADYCGHGTPFTVAGKRIQVRDTTGRQNPSLKRYGALEAVWGVDGAVCVRRPRVPTAFPIRVILQTCPELREQVGEHCTEEVLQRHPKALLSNRSEP